MIKNIAFDMGGVLIDWKPAEFCKRFKVTSDEDIHLLINATYASQEWFDYDEGKIKMADLQKACLEKVPSRLRGVCKKLINQWTLVCYPTEGMLELLQTLKRNGYHLFLLSNAGYNQPAYFRKFPYTDVFEGKIVSAFYHLLKPDVRIFELLCHKYHLRQEETFFMDDNQVNVDGAIRAGLKACLFKDCEQLKEEMRKLGIKVD